jgi:hypothetical protein
VQQPYEPLGSPNISRLAVPNNHTAHVHGHMWGKRRNEERATAHLGKLNATSAPACASSVCCTKHHTCL